MTINSRLETRDFQVVDGKTMAYGVDGDSYETMRQYEVEVTQETHLEIGPRKTRCFEPVYLDGKFYQPI